MNIDPESGWKIFDYAWTVVAALLGLVWKSQNDKLQDLRADVDRQMKAQKEELDKQRANIAKLFDKLEDAQRRAEERHHKLLEAIHDRRQG